MLSNLSYFTYAQQHQEALLDPQYHLAVERTVIQPATAGSSRLLQAYNAVINHISAIDTQICAHGSDYTSPAVIDHITAIIAELAVPGMNYCPLCQYFNIHNMNYSLFFKKSLNEQIAILQFILRFYIPDRHRLYLSYGYSPIVLQVMSDNYSHKRKAGYGANKIAIQLEALGIHNLVNLPNATLDSDTYYLLADKTGKRLFQQFAKAHGIPLADGSRKTEKYPDALIKIGDHYFIIEQKNMKEDGGGQDKQTLEITAFISQHPVFDKLHYVTYIDGVYFNTLCDNATFKKHDQYEDILHTLKTNPANYFVNQNAFEKLITDCINATGK